MLNAGDPDPIGVQNAGACSPFVLVCDHAGREVPAALGALGLPRSAFDLHIAWDIGALILARRLSERLNACLIFQRYSRLVVDCNRAPGHRGLVAETSDGWVIPGNLNLDEAGVQGRLDAIHSPYHARITAQLEASPPLLLVCVHSFTPRMDGVRRPWHVGVLHGGASAASEALLRLLRREPGLVVGDNEPYAMDGTDYTAPRHAWERGLDVIELEVRQDLLSDEAQSEQIAELMTRLLPQTLPVADR